MKVRVVQILLFTLMAASVLSSKHGLAWPWNGIAQDFTLFKGSNKISWVYNWESWRPSGLPAKFEYVAMQRTPNGIEGLQNNMRSNGAKALLGFNEPERSDQANISPDRAVQLWRQYIQPLSYSHQIGSPGISNGNNGIPWLTQFMSKCNGCKIDFIDCHWYGPNFSQFKSHIENVHRNFPNKKIWVTEFALQGQPSQHDQNAFMSQAVSFLDSQNYIERYAWFGAFRGDAGNNLINNGGGLTDIGRSYAY